MVAFEVYVAFTVYLFSIIGVIVGYNMLKNQIKQSAESLNSDGIEVNLDGLREEIFEIIEEFMANMHTPTFLDHIGGALGQFVNYKLMKTMQADNMLSNLIGDHGEPLEQIETA